MSIVKNNDNDLKNYENGLSQYSAYFFRFPGLVRSALYRDIVLDQQRKTHYEDRIKEMVSNL